MKHIPALNVPHKLLKEFTYSFDLYKSTLDVWYDIIYITPDKVGHAIDLNPSGKNLFYNIFYKSNFGIFFTLFSCY
ncbi:hypothetical protein AHAS_Ahas06G0145300 [Arachis hypogaea]